MSPRLLIGLVALSGSLLVSCVPYKENHGPGPVTKKTDPAAPTREQIEMQKEKDELKKKDLAEKQKKEDELKAGNTEPGPADGKPEEKPAHKPGKDAPVASKIPGKDGFVLSPYNNKMVDVRDIPSGTLVQDPTQTSEKKLFRVP